MEKDIILNKMVVKNNFDWKFYLLFNPDILQIYDYSKQSAVDHYNEYGLKENRIYNEYVLYEAYPLLKHFDYKYYYKENRDLKDINDKYQLILHYINQGSKENRNINFNNTIFSYFDFEPFTRQFNQPRLSVILPVYNREKSLKSCIESILNQSYQNIQLIIVNDNSTDKSMDIINTFNDNPNVIIMSNDKNYGCYISINLALTLVDGEYITVHGSDDISFHDRYNKCMYEMIENNLLVCGNYIYRSHLTTFNDMYSHSAKTIFNKIASQNIIEKKHISECCNPIVALGILIYHKSVINNIGPFENVRKGGDMIFFEKYLYNYENIKFEEKDCSHRYLTEHNKGKKYKIINEILYLSIEMDGNNLTSQKTTFDINQYRKVYYL